MFSIAALLLAAALQPPASTPVRHARTPTPAELASAYNSDETREFVTRARASRLLVDSSLRSYRATSYERVTAGGSVAAVGREKLLERRETVGVVSWSQAGGAHIELKGRRRERTAGLAPPNPTGDLLVPVPWYPGMDALWLPSANGPTGRAGRDETVDTTEIVHPIAVGAEAYYTYALGDSASIALGNGQRIRLRELRTRPRRPRWNLSVGSYWFDTDRMQLVRAIYRLSVPYDVWTEVDNAGEKGPAWYIKAFAQPLKAELQAVTLEYGLYDGRFWLPRVRRVDGTINGGPLKASVTIEQGFRYDDVNAVAAVPAIPDANLALRASLDSINALRTQLRGERAGLRTAADSAAWRRRVAATDSMITRYEQRFNAQVVRDCKTSGVRYSTGSRLGDALRTRIVVPCDSTALANAPELNGGLFAERREVYASTLDEATRTALGLDVQAAFAPQRVTTHAGVEYLRFNRVEGLSVGAALRQQLGAGWSWESNARFSFADQQINAEALAHRSNGAGTLTFAAYRRLAQADDYGTAFGTLTSLRNFTTADDQHFYYRTAGAEIIRQRTGLGAGSRQSEWRLFGEWQSSASTQATTSALSLLGGDRRFGDGVVDTLAPTPVRAFGVAYQTRFSRGADEVGWRAANAWRFETASGTRTYARLATDVTIGRAYTQRWRSTVLLAAGTSVGALPVHRLWNVGGWQTLRGYRGGEMRGDSYWLARTETTWARRGWVQPGVFADAGWAGPRAMSVRDHVARSSVGAGVGIYELPVRLEAARTLGGNSVWSFALYAPVRF